MRVQLRNDYRALNQMNKTKKQKCYNCLHGGYQFKIDKLTHLHCEHPDVPEKDYGWGTLMVFSDSCKKHEFRPTKK